MTKLLSVLVVISLIIAVMAIELVLLHWAVGLFYPITWTQAFGLSLLIAILGAAFRSRNRS
jgi:hypothetical protein